MNLQKNTLPAAQLLTLFILVTLFSASCKKSTVGGGPHKPLEGKYYVKRISYPDSPPIAGGDFSFNYNSKNQVIEIVQKNVGKIKVDYTSDGRIAKTTSTGLFPGHTDYFYFNGHLSKEVRYQVSSDQNGGVHTSRQSFEYEVNSEGKPEVIKSYNGSDDIRAYAQIIYDGGGNPTKIISTSGIEYNYHYNSDPYVLYPENEGIYNCLENLIVFTSVLSQSVPAELNYALPFLKQIREIHFRSSGGNRHLYTFSYQKNEQGLIRQLTAKYGTNASPTVYTFEYERR